MEIRLDLHIHSSASSDSDSQPEEILKRAKQAGLNTIGITDHGTVKGAIEVRKASKDIRVLIGQEIHTSQGDILVFNLQDNLEQNQDLSKTCSEAREKGGFIIIPHPFDSFRSSVGDHLKKIINFVDAIEVFNSKAFFNKPNLLAKQFALKNNMPIIAGSDAHFVHDIGNAINVYPTSKPLDKITDDEIFKIIKTERPKMLTKKISVPRFLTAKIISRF